MRQLLSLFVLTLLACSSDADGPKAIHGENDLLPVADHLTNLPDVLHHVADAIGSVPRGCTVTHLGSGVAITAGHCFYDLDDCRKQSIFWRYRGTGRETVMVSRCTSFIVQRNSGEDYALITVEPIPPGKAYAAWDRRIQDGEAVTLLSHPMSRPLEWSQYSTATVDASGKFRHQCDTENGSSGAPVLDPATGEILAIHNDAAGGATPVAAISRAAVDAAKRLIAQNLPAKTREDWYLKTWRQERTGLRWQLAALTITEEEARQACGRLGARLPSDDELHFAVLDGLRDEARNPEFGFVAKALEFAWSSEGAQRLQVTTSFKTHHPLFCVR